MGRFAFVLLLLSAVAAAQPEEAARKLAGMTVVFSVDSPLDIPGAVIQPGTYVLRIVGEPRAGERIQLQLWDAGQNNVLAEMFAMHSPAQGTESSILTYYEGASGRRILKAWNLLRTGYSERIVYTPEQAAELSKVTSEAVLTMPGAAPVSTASQTLPNGRGSDPGDAVVPDSYPKTAGSLPIVLWVGFTALAAFAVFRIYRTDTGAAQNARNHAVARRAAAAAYRTYQATAGKEA
jgi:hypothetical protein